MAAGCLGNIEAAPISIVLTERLCAFWRGDSISELEKKEVYGRTRQNYIVE